MAWALELGRLDLGLKLLLFILGNLSTAGQKILIFEGEPLSFNLNIYITL